MSPRRILLVVPYKARDFEGHALVAHYLRARYGHEVMFSNGYGIESKLLRYSPDALVLDHLAWDFKASQARLAVRLGVKLIILSTEGLFQDPEGATRRTGKLHGVASLPDCYIVWGEYPRRAILEQELMPPSRIHVPGCPRFDLYREPFTTLRRSRRDFLAQFGFQNPDAPLILWATNTPYASRSSRAILDRYVRRARFSTSEGLDLVQDQRTQLQEQSRLVLALARRHPEWNIVVKVHPAEWLDPYLELARTVPGIRIAFDAPIQDFVRHCDVLIQRNCTTATEAWMVDKPVLNADIGEYRLPVRREYVEGNDVVRSLEEAEALIRAYLGGRRVPDEQRAARAAFIEEFYYRIDGSSAGRVAELIDRTVSSPAYSDEDQEMTRDTIRRERAESERADSRRVVTRIKDGLGIPRSTSLRFWRKLAARDSRVTIGAPGAEAEVSSGAIEDLLGKYDALLSDGVGAGS